jgi:RNase adaptor protein for sRNA GlmZ degradation
MDSSSTHVETGPRDGADVIITTYGIRHRNPPAETMPVISLGLTELLRNPADDPAMIHMTGLDEKVRRHVLATPGATELIEQMIGRIAAAHAYTRRRNMRQDAHVYCQGGRHRSVVIGEEVAAGLRGHGLLVEVVHLDINQPILPPSEPAKD